MSFWDILKGIGELCDAFNKGFNSTYSINNTHSTDEPNSSTEQKKCSTCLFYEYNYPYGHCSYHDIQRVDTDTCIDNSYIEL